MESAWSVNDLNRYVRGQLESDFRLRDLQVQGEISGFRAYPSGHWYFTLKDATSQISCVLWKSRAEKIRLRPRDGDAVIALGNVTLYEARGQYQFDVISLQLQGEGELYRRYVQLKDRLEAEGLFATERKRPLPRLPNSIGLVTSPAGAALRDMLNILRRRAPLAEVILAPTAVQGPDAPAQLVAALRALAGLPDDNRPEVVIVGRGGGSLEDLWAFNNEAVARQIAAMPMPVVSGVGHETDFTIADFVADLRAPTPSAAAELVSALEVRQLRLELDTQLQTLLDLMTTWLDTERSELAQVRARLGRLSPQTQLLNNQHGLDLLHRRLLLAQAHYLMLWRERLIGLTQRLQAASPLAVLQRGYAIVTRAEGQVVGAVDEVAAGERVTVRVSDGTFVARVET